MLEESRPRCSHGLWFAPNICAVSGGCAYVIDAAAPERFTMLPFRQVLEVRPSSPRTPPLRRLSLHARLGREPPGLAIGAGFGRRHNSHLHRRQRPLRSWLRPYDGQRNPLRPRPPDRATNFIRSRLNCACAVGRLTLRNCEVRHTRSLRESMA